jgi:pimeloyl-ACP methyl ester carboxylesterase
VLRRVLRVFGSIAIFLALIYVGVCYIAYRRYRSALFPAPPETMGVHPPGATLRELTADDGAPVHLLHWPPPRTGARTIVYFHGNSDTMGQSVGFALDLHARGFGVALVEYRGYGISKPGTPTEKGLYLDAKAALDALQHDGLDADRIVLWGTSLGTGVAAEMARRGRCAGLVLVSPYTSIAELGHHFIPYLPSELIVADRFDTLSKAPQIVVPTMVVHGLADDVVPYAMGEQVARAISGAHLVTVPTGHHNDLFQREGRRLMDRITSFARGAN